MQTFSLFDDQNLLTTFQNIFEKTAQTKQLSNEQLEIVLKMLQNLLVEAQFAQVKPEAFTDLKTLLDNLLKSQAVDSKGQPIVANGQLPGYTAVANHWVNIQSLQELLQQYATAATTQTGIAATYLKGQLAHISSELKTDPNAKQVADQITNTLNPAKPEVSQKTNQPATNNQPTNDQAVQTQQPNTTDGAPTGISDILPLPFQGGALYMIEIQGFPAKLQNYILRVGTRLQNPMRFNEYIAEATNELTNYVRSYQMLVPYPGNTFITLPSDPEASYFYNYLNRIFSPRDNPELRGKTLSTNRGGSSQAKAAAEALMDIAMKINEFFVGLRGEPGIYQDAHYKSEFDNQAQLATKLANALKGAADQFQRDVSNIGRQ